MICDTDRTTAICVTGSITDTPPRTSGTIDFMTGWSMSPSMTDWSMIRRTADARIALTHSSPSTSTSKRMELPEGCKVVGALYGAEDPRDLGEDMLEVSLLNGRLISAGWYPEGSPDGSYRISVTQGLDDVVSPLYADNLALAELLVSFLAGMANEKAAS